MTEDFDDTVIRVRGTSPSIDGTDLDDTVVRGPRPASQPVEDAPPQQQSAQESPPPDAPAPPKLTSAPRGSSRHFAIRIGEAGALIPLDVPSLIGRRPRAPRIITGLPPRLVTVESPRREVSSTHVELRQVGGAIVVTDLGSTNGTVVHVPGLVPRTLRQRESVTVSAGTRIDLGDDIVVYVVAPTPVATGMTGAHA
ncbi:hypothetical protein M2152_000751 [Microbacteriaceae bacterium SG_E_30_P1]|uniref:FHA domain-containing protein n=1 Tax=Antiquaquibacter oligotrophicus TaxID=2880260 RepID=A0ABT6KKP6_9MICO|nr:FHA domain-containing protein [Antiquaquibacter oligotrophicus]MDH6180569.1 hypothetical protein [Antiquaquibacter oligotrophicus]UDF13698.1 FHA domain-containing protein [Antiquaquibacter oligotrophicus]